MDKYGRQAMRAWQENLPEEFAQIEDPERFFADLGNQIEEQVQQIEDSILRAEGLSKDYMTQVGQRNMARLCAEEAAMDDLVWSRMPSQEETDEAEEENPEETEQPERLVDSQGMPTALNHPLWALRRDETITDEEYGRAYDQWWAEMEALGQV